MARHARRSSRYRHSLKTKVAWGEILSTFAAAAARGKNGWTASELDLSGLADIDEVVDALRDVEPDAEVALLFVESDDQYLAILRLDEGEDLRVFGSDSAFAEESRIGLGAARRGGGAGAGDRRPDRRRTTTTRRPSGRRPRRRPGR